MQKQIFISLVLSIIISLSLAQKATKNQVIAMENFEKLFSSCAAKAKDVCTSGSQSLRKNKDYIFVKHNFQNMNQDMLHIYNFQANTTKNSTSPPTNTTTPKNTTDPNPKNGTNPEPPKNTTTPQPPKNDTTPQPPKNDTTPQPPKNDTTPQPPKNTTTPQPPKNDTTPQPPKNNTNPNPEPPKNNTNPNPKPNPNPNPNPSGPSSEDRVKCKGATDFYWKCMTGGYELVNYQKYQYYDENFNSFAKYLEQISLTCEQQALTNYQNSPLAKAQIDQYQSCYSGMVGVKISPSSEQTTISQFGRYSEGCKKKFASTCDKTCTDNYAKFEYCVFTCENTIYVSTAYQINQQVKNHITNCLLQCNRNFNVSSDKKTSPILTCLTENSELTNGTKISGSILQFFSLLTALFLLAL